MREFFIDVLVSAIGFTIALAVISIVEGFMKRRAGK